MHVLRYFSTKKIRVRIFCLDHASFRLLSPTEYFIDVYLTNTIEENKSLALFLWVMTGVPTWQMQSLALTHSEYPPQS